MPPRRSTRNKSTNINATTTSGNTDNPPELASALSLPLKKGKKESTVEESEGNSAKKRKGKKGRGCKSATQCIAEDASASSPVKLTRAEQNIVDDGTSVAPPKRICNAVAPVATSGRIRRSEVLDNESTESENANEDTSAGENASNNPSDDSGSEIEEVSSKHNKSNEDTGNQTSKDTHKKDSEDTGNQTSKDTCNKSNENTDQQGCPQQEQ
ncbi:hypothetical protein BDQ17DRAFT_1491498 [Cyathus striatus]|nr:hypothetical protein BDQ17DRAFT_1491498 [Cyathus striatus]